ncbi:MAG: DUF4304 domain-containing protein [Planctomycetota bacterium]
MTSNDPFVERVKHEFVPRLRAQGFRGSFPRLQRVSGDLVHEIEIQGWKYGGQRTINLSLGFTFIQPAPVNKTYATEYSYRIGTSDGRDRWWNYSTHDTQECVTRADEMIEVFDRESPSFFERFATFPDSFAHFSPTDFVDAPQSYLLPRVGGGRMIARDCWIFTQIWEHLDDRERAAEFARIGLEHIGSAGGLRKIFENAISNAEIVG